MVMLSSTVVCVWRVGVVIYVVTAVFRGSICGVSRVCMLRLVMYRV